MMETPFYTPHKASKIMRLLWSAAGADSVILEKSTYSDQVKYMCLGGIIFATGVMAALAGGYAFYTIFSPRGSAIEEENFFYYEVPEIIKVAIDSIGVTKDSIIHTQSMYPIDNKSVMHFNWGLLMTMILSIVFGVLWGLMIFNLDRFIVSSTGKGDGTEAITWGELKGAIPRIIMGAIIALTISKPIEIRMFKSEIDVELHNHQMKKEEEFLAELDSIFFGRIESEKNKISNWEKEINAKTTRAVELENQYIEEARIINVGPRARAVKKQWDRAKSEEQQLKDKYTPLIEESYNNIKKFEIEKNKKINESSRVSNGLDGLLERIHLAHKIAGFWISLFITLLFMAIELTPIFFKLMLVKSPYDFMKDNIEERIKADNGIYVEYNYHKDKKGQERDLVVFLDSEKLILEKKEIQRAQKELTEYAISKYKEDMKKKIDENPSAFIKVQDNKL